MALSQTIALLKVERLGPKAFEQAAGFLSHYKRHKPT